jgi:hypothetical protein
MRRITLITLIGCLATCGLVMGNVSAEEIILPLEGGVYHMITSPVLPQDPDPQVNLEDDLGACKKRRWRLLLWDEADRDYVELKTPDWDPERHDFNFGRGYWIVSRRTETIDIQGDPPEDNYIILKGTPQGDGWNQIGSIYLEDFPIGMFPHCNLWVTPVSGGIFFQLNDPLNPYTHVTLKEYTGGSSYTDIGDEPGEQLEAGRAYWLRNIRNEDVILFFAPTDATSTSVTDFPSPEFYERVAGQEDPPDPPGGIAASSGGGSSGGSGGCFVATVTYGNYDHPRVQLLREFRDRHLSTNGFGRMCVNKYYRYSPSVANFIAEHDTVKAIIRVNLLPLVGISALISTVSNSCFLIGLVLPLMGTFFLLRRGRGV